MRYSIVVLAIFLAIGCSEKVQKEDLKLLNGYWEITEVNFPNGQTKEYTINPSIDYIQLKGLEGFKKKVHPKFDGTYDTSNDAENFKIIEKDGVFSFHYKNNLSEWEEHLNNLEENTFSIVNEANVTYTYKRYQPLDLE